MFFSWFFVCLFVPFTLGEGLPLKKTQINLVFCSLIRTFAVEIVLNGKLYVTPKTKQDYD